MAYEVGVVLRIIGYGLAALAVIALMSTWQHRSEQLRSARASLKKCADSYSALSTHSSEQQRIIDALRLQVELQAAH